MRKFILPLFAGAVLAGCSSMSQGVRQVQFACDDNSEITVEFGVETATVRREDGKAFVLPQEMAASGFWYSSGRYDLRGKGDEVTWTDDTRRPRLCTVK